MRACVPLGSVAEIDRNGISPTEISPGSLYVGLEHIESDGSVANAPTVDRGELGSTKFRFSSRHVLFGKLRPYLRKVARPLFAGICSTDIIPILPSKRVDRDYLFHFLRTDAVIERAAALSVGMNLPRLNPRDLLNFEIPLPSLDEQRHIATILDKADELRRKRRLALEKINDLRESRYQSLALEPGADAWPQSKISEVAKIIRTGPFGSQLLHSEFVEHGVAVLGIDNTQHNEFSWSQRRYISEAKYRALSRYTVRTGDVLITIMGTCGRCVIVPANTPLAINTKHLCCVRLNPRKCRPELLHAAIVYDRDLRAQLGARERGAVMPGLNMHLIKETSFRVPPLEVQDRFTTDVRQIKALELIQRKHLEALDALFTSVQHHAFSGTLAPSTTAAKIASLRRDAAELAV